jgi:tRNA A37 N6-isopentenylltransferase MiaA
MSRQKYGALAAICFFVLAGSIVADEPNLHQELRKELAAMVKVDQEVRNEFIKLLNKENADSDAAKKGDSPLAKKLEEIDRKNTARMKEIVAKHGWPGKSVVGADGAHDAWLLIQHADKDRDFQKRCLALMKDMAKGEVSGQDIAYLSDRVLVGDGKKQLYGTQCQVVNGEVKFQPIEDEANVDKRRVEIGLMPLAEYKKVIEEIYKPKGKKETKPIGQS